MLYVRICSTTWRARASSWWVLTPLSVHVKGYRVDVKGYGADVKAYLLCHLAGAGQLVAGVDAVEPRVQQEVLLHGQVRPQNVELRADAEHAVDLPPLGARVKPRNGRLAGGQVHVACHTNREGVGRGSGARNGRLAGGQVHVACRTNRERIYRSSLDARKP
eukprot:217494-Pyramimonas_sp.AAC.1